eukprot:13853328-Alexandrium_andersonii.AAC.1
MGQAVAQPTAMALGVGLWRRQRGPRGIVGEHAQGRGRAPRRAEVCHPVLRQLEVLRESPGQGGLSP